LIVATGGIEDAIVEAAEPESPEGGVQAAVATAAATRRRGS
jgi:hypothetical protein